MQMNQDFTQGKIFAPLMGFTASLLASMFLQTLYGAVDMMIVGRFCAPEEIAAVSTGSILMQNITIVITGLSLGTAILMGQKFGEGKLDELGPVVGASICLFGLIGAVLAVSMQWLAKYCLAAMCTPEEAFAAAARYVKICSAGAPFIVAYNVLGSIFRGIGNARIPLLSVAIACMANIVGDWILVGPMDMGAAGAALATIAAQGFSVVLSAFIITRQGLPFPFARADVRFHWSVIRRVLLLGFPVALQDALVNISFLVITAIVNTLGVVTAAGIGIAERLCGFVMLVPSSCGQAMSSFTAQNIGAGQPERARRALAIAILSALSVGVFMGWGAFFHGDVLTGLFVQGQPEVAAAAWSYLRAFAIDCLLTSFLFCFIGYFNGCGRTQFSMWQGIVGAFGVRVPVSWLMSRVVPVSVFKVGLATPCSSVVQILLCAGYFVRLRRRGEA